MAYIVILVSALLIIVNMKWQCFDLVRLFARFHLKMQSLNCIALGSDRPTVVHVHGM